WTMPERVLSYRTGCSENYLLRGGARFEGDFLSQGFQTLEQLAGQPLRRQPLQEVHAPLRVPRAPLEHVVDDPPQRAAPRPQPPPPAPPLGQPPGRRRPPRPLAPPSRPTR